MKYLIISDTHLTDKVEKRKLKFLMNLIKDYQNIIINGDFWEARYVDADKFLNSGYKPLLEALKAKKTVYIYGNHDPIDSAEIVAKEITSDRRNFINIQSGDKKLHIEHGHRFIPVNKSKWSNNRKILKYTDMTGSGILERFMFPLTVGLLGKKWNQITLSMINSDPLIQTDAILVCGHTHVTIFDIDKRFIDIGKIRANAASYLIVEDGKIDLIKKRY